MQELKISKALVDSDLDGVVCAALLSIVFPGLRIRLTEASAIQAGAESEYVNDQTVIADLSYIKGCGLYFDHHHSNKPNEQVVGSWLPLNSAAEVIYEFYKDKVDLERFKKLIDKLGRFDSGLTTLEELQHLDDYLLMAFSVERQDKAFSLKLIKALASLRWEEVLRLDFVQDKMNKCRRDIDSYYEYIKQNHQLIDNVIFVDNRRFKSNMAHAFFVADQFPQVDSIIMIKQIKDEFRVTMFWNNFNASTKKYDLLSIAKSLNPQVSGGHKGACGASLPAGLGYEKIREMILEQLKQQS